MLTNDDAAKMLGVSKRTLQRMRSENRIDFIKIGNQCRYQVEAIFNDTTPRVTDPTTGDKYPPLS